MRIVFNSNTSFSIYNFRLGLMRHLKSNGFVPIAVSPEDDFSLPLKSEFDYYAVKNLDRKGTNPIKDMKLFFEYLIIFKNIKPSIVINYTIKPNIYGSLACGILGIKSISVVTGLGYAFSKGIMLRELVKLMYRISFMFNRYVLILNHGDMEVIKKLVFEKKIFILNGEGVDTTRYNPYLFKEIKKDRNLIFLYIGRFLREKGIYELVEACKLLYKDRKDFELWFLGSIDKGNPGSLSEEELNQIKKLEFVKVL
ncbi:MAG: glycosyltransferase, partial [Thermodesulfovibrio sp.]|nr:glycosyltransferase [Thermodesulfovibrio sp.]